MNRAKLLKRASKLIEITRSISELYEQQLKLKTQLAPYVCVDAPLLLDEGEVYEHHYEVKKTVSRDEVLRFLKLNYGPIIANAVDVNCSKGGRTLQRIKVDVYKDGHYH